MVSLTPKPAFTPAAEAPLRVRGRFRPSRRKPLALSRFQPAPPKATIKPSSRLHEEALRRQTNKYQTLSPDQRKQFRAQRAIEVQWKNAELRKRFAERKRGPRVHYKPLGFGDNDVFYDVLHRVHSLNINDRFT